MITCKVHAGNKYHRKQRHEMFQRIVEKYSNSKGFLTDGIYCRTSVKFVEEILGLKLEISKRIKNEVV